VTVTVASGVIKREMTRATFRGWQSNRESVVASEPINFEAQDSESPMLRGRRPGLRARAESERKERRL
jgi:hypothetical protein